MWGALGVGALAMLRSSPVNTFVDPLSAGALTSIENALLQSMQPGLTLGYATQTSGAYDNERCNCERKRGKKHRMCLERAMVVWAGGRRKGKAAGTRCISRERA
jgi:hypothetical protein